tara:strand:- start:183 stop:1022 length:840 start_codon:yes stop_codon:yes gene_type:complete
MAQYSYDTWDQLIDDLNTDSPNLTYEQINSLKSGGKFTKIKYHGKNLTLKTKGLIAPFGAKENQFENNPMKKTIEFELPREDDVCDESNKNEVALFKLKQVLTALHDKIKRDILKDDYQREWLGIKGKSKKITNANIDLVLADIIKNNDSDKWRPRFKAKFPHMKDSATFQIWDENKKEIISPPLNLTAENEETYVSLEKIIPRRTEIRIAVIDLSSIWIINDKVGSTFNIRTLRIAKIPELASGKCIVDSDDDDDDESQSKLQGVEVISDSDDDDDSD